MLNERLTSWIEEEYHQRVHSSTSRTPLQRYLAHLEALKAAPKDLWDYFRVSARRKVDKDRTVSVNGALFEALVGLIGKTVTLLYHKHDPKRVEVLHDEKSHGFLVPRQNPEVVYDEPLKDHPQYRGGSRKPADRHELRRRIGDPEVRNFSGYQSGQRLQIQSHLFGRIGPMQPRDE